jgi:hypothetical protein
MNNGSSSQHLNAAVSQEKCSHVCYSWSILYVADVLQKTFGAGLCKFGSFSKWVCLEHILFANSYPKLVSKCSSNPMGTFFANSYALTY